MVAAAERALSLVLDATPLQNAHAHRGIGTYVRGLLATLELAGSDAWGVLAYPEPIDGLRDRRTVRPTVPRRPRVLEFHGGWVLDELLLGGRLARAGAFHATDPRRVPKRRRSPVVATIYDLTPLHDAEVWRALWPDQRVAYRLSLRRARAADAIVAISEAVKGDVIRTLSVPPSRVHVVYPAVEAPQVPPIASGRGGVLYVGSAEPHKNVDRLLTALALLPQPHRPPLTIAGPWSPDAVREAHFRATDLGIARPTIEPYATAERLERLYSLAALLVLPSRREGFGLPVVEAMARGLPVVAADIPVLREVGADAVRLVPADDPAALAREIRRLMDDQAELDAMARAGLARATHFTPAAALQALLAAYRSIGIDLQ